MTKTKHPYAIRSEGHIRIVQAEGPVQAALLTFDQCTADMEFLALDFGAVALLTGGWRKLVDDDGFWLFIKEEKP